MTAIAAKPPISSARAIIVASIGNALEWFDLIIFGFLSVVMARQFFPSDDPSTALLLTLATFGISFVIRPLGGLVLGIYADRAGRMRALTMSATLMMIGTGMIAFMPTYADIGILATIGLVLARLIQGFSAGGEFASATAFLAEQSRERRGFFASWQIASQGITTILASATGAALFGLLSPEQLDAWGWRLPFAFGMLIGPVALYIRLRVPETPEFEAAETAEHPLREVWTEQRPRLFIAVAVTVLGTISNFVILFTPTFASQELGIAPRDAFFATLATGVVQFLLAPPIGWLGDRIGRVKVMLTSATAMLLLIAPVYSLLIAHPTAATLIGVQILYGILATSYFASQPAFMSDLFPVRTRGTGMSLGYNIAVTVFGGVAPLIVATLIQVTGSKLAPSFYVMFGAAISLIGLLAYQALGRRERASGAALAV
jgi:MHS family proline/betaine transporter-like MFS transporter